MTKPQRVLIVEISWPLGSLLAGALSDEGMVAEIADPALDTMAHKRRFQPDVVVIGLGLSYMNGISVVRQFAGEGDCGVIVVASDDIESAHVESLDEGADDYIVEPMASRKLAARIRAVGRRVSRGEAATHRFRVRVDINKRGLIGPGNAVSTLTEAEFAVMRALLEAAGGPVSREGLGRAALKRTLHQEDRSVDQLVLKLRRKFAQHGLAERAIQSSRGLGYSIPEPSMFEMPRSAAPPLSMMPPLGMVPPLGMAPPVGMLPIPSEVIERSAGGP